MAVTGRIKAAWAGWPLLYRILLAQGGLLLLGATLFVALMMFQDRAEAIADGHDRSRLLLLIATPLVAESAITGDVATARQLLERQATAYPDVSRLVWRAPGRDDIGAAPSRIAEPTPEWFRFLVDISTVTRSAEISLGGVSYGDLEVTLSPVRVERELWDDFVSYAWLALGAAGVLFFALTLMMRAPLRAMRDLAAGAERFGRGEYGTRVEPRGALETRGVALAFNSMAERMQEMVMQLLDGRKQLREQLHFTEALIEALPVPMYYKDSSGTYRSVNRAWEQFFGVARDDMIGRKVIDLYTHAPKETPYHEKMDNALLANPGVQSYEIPLTTRDGRVREALFSKATMTDADDHVTGLIGIITDLTELKQAEQQALEAMLQKASAEQASQAKSMFLANMSHEIRTPLTPIIGFAETLLQDNPDPETRNALLNAIIRNGRHLLSIIHEILDLSKIEAGSLEVELIDVDISSLFHDIHSLIITQAVKKGLEYRQGFINPVPRHIRSDPTRIKQILMNLLTNAVKFTERGHIGLYCEFDPERKRLNFMVCDTGIGIPQDKLDRLFKPFSQADSSTTRRYGGTGLGLHISQRLSNLLGGDISVSSQAEGGSKFTASIAVENCDMNDLIGAPDISASAPIPAAELPTQIPQLSGHILVAEDMADNQLLIGHFIKKTGAQVSFAENGQVALEMAMAHDYDLILMDMQMPVMSGSEAVELLRAAGCQTAIVALTANAMKGERDIYIRIGCNDFLGKPVRQQAFYHVLAKYLPKAGSGTPSGHAIPGHSEEDGEFLKLQAGFLTSLDGYVEQLRQAMAKDDRAEATELAHQLKGLGGSFGFPEITDRAGQLEVALKTGQYAQSKELGACLCELLVKCALTRKPSPID